MFCYKSNLIGPLKSWNTSRHFEFACKICLKAFATTEGLKQYPIEHQPKTFQCPKYEKCYRYKEDYLPRVSYCE